MQAPLGALRIWFGREPSEDAAYLTAWRDAAITYAPATALDSSWNVDRYEVILGHDTTGALFRRAAQLVLRNQFYPQEVMTTVSDFSLEDRPVRVGDRIVQRIRIFQYNTKPILEVLTMNEITQVIDEPRQAGFTYTTTQAHSEIGEWSPRVEWRENGEVALIIEVVSRSMPGTSPLAQRLTRRLQLRAHAMSIENFRALLAGRTYYPQSDAPLTMGHMAPVAAATFSALLVFYMLNRRRR
jgi:uncharacterized protein (UPF0548 family)